MKKLKSFRNMDEHIVKTDGGYKLVSKKSGKNLGTASSLEGIKKRERQVQYFKHMKEDGVGMVGGSPVNNVGGGDIAGLGVGRQGEPGVGKGKKPMPFKSYFKRKLPQ